MPGINDCRRVVLEFQVPKLPHGQISGLKFRKGSHELGISRSSEQEASDVYSVDLQRGTFDRWTESETGGLNTLTFAEPSQIEYKTFDGRQIPAFVYRPPAAKFPGPRPVLVEIHGGPEAQFASGFLGRLNYLVSELGIVLVMPNVRGSSGYGKTYLKLDNGMLREGAVKDIGALLDWIAQQPDLDKQRVAVAGGSYGGFMSLAVQTTYNDRIKAGIDIVGISNFVTFLQNTQGYRRDLRRAEYGDERDPQMRAFLERISPLTTVGKIHTPILIVQGQNDPRVPISEAEQVAAAVRKNGVPVWYVVGKNEGHGFARKINQDYLQAVEVLFLRRFLLGEEKSPARRCRSDRVLPREVTMPFTPTMPPTLEVVQASQTVQVCEITGQDFHIGRLTNLDLFIDDIRVSRPHARIQRLPDDSYELVDLDSQNGTILGGKRLCAVPSRAATRWRPDQDRRVRADFSPTCLRTSRVAERQHDRAGLTRRSQLGSPGQALEAPRGDAQGHSGGRSGARGRSQSG